MSFIMSRRIRRSFSPVAQSIARTGSPHLSFLVASIVTRFAWLGSISPKAVAPMLHGPGWAMASLNAPPTPSSAPAGAPLVAEAPQVRPLVAEQIAVARDVEAGGSPAIVILVIEPFDRTLRTHTKVMIHQVVPQLSGARPQPVGPHLRRGA